LTVGAELIHVDGRTDGHDEGNKALLATYVRPPKNEMSVYGPDLCHHEIGTITGLFGTR